MAPIDPHLVAARLGRERIGDNGTAGSVGVDEVFAGKHDQGVGQVDSETGSSSGQCLWGWDDTGGELAQDPQVEPPFLVGEAADSRSSLPFGRNLRCLKHVYLGRHYDSLLISAADYARAMSTVLSEAPFQLPAAPVRSDLVAKYFRTLADPTRLRILQLLAQAGELPVGEIASRLGVTQPGVSNHLACLRWCGFVATRREHRTVFNYLADERVLTLLDLGDALLAENAEHVAACCHTEEDR